MKTTQYSIRTAYACNDLARARKGAQDIIGYDVYNRETGVVEVICETMEEAESELAIVLASKL